jgi:ABC-type antimicrobial peptide transport system permease subunit
VIVSQAFVKRYSAGSSPIGRHLMFGGSNRPVFDHEIVGVVPDTRTAVRARATETVYMPYAQWTRPQRLVYYVRTAGDQTQLSNSIRRAIREADANLPTPNISALDVKIRDSLYTERLIAVLSEAFGILASLLAAIGLYGLIAYSVARRTAEIGIRMALGARPGDVLALILKGAAGMAAAGIGTGLAGAFVLSRLVESQLFGIKPADPRVLAGAAASLALVALMAAWVPGWRASRIDPVRALKHD